MRQVSVIAGVLYVAMTGAAFAQQVAATTTMTTTVAKPAPKPQAATTTTTTTTTVATPAPQEDVYNLWGYLGQNPDGKKVDFKEEYESAKADAKTNWVDSMTEQTVAFKDDLYEGTRELRDWLLTPPVKKPPQPIRASYCYRSFQDILCYRQPMVGWEHRLVSYQGTNAEPPPVAYTKPLPTRTANEAMLPANRVVNAQPVFVGIPAELKEEKKNIDPTAPISLDAAQETLPNPALTPQF